MSARIGIEVLIEEAEAIMRVEEIASASPRLEALVFGMGDYSASQGIDPRAISADCGYPGDIWHYARNKMIVAARTYGLDAVDGPFVNFKGRRLVPHGMRSRKAARRRREMGNPSQPG